MANKRFIANKGFDLGNNTGLPSSSPTLSLNFTSGKSLDPRFTFERSSTATYWEPGRQEMAEHNILVRSSQLSTTYWSQFRSTNTASQTGPDGSTEALLHAGDGSTGEGTGIYSSSVNYSSYSTEYALSCFAKANGHQYIYIGTNNNQDKIVSFDLSGNGSVIDEATGYTGSITKLGDGWYRCVVGLDTSTAAEDNFFIMGLCQSDGDLTGTYATDDQVYFYGPMVQFGTQTASHYTPTTSAKVITYNPSMQTASTGEPRFETNPETGVAQGMKIEATRTNLCYPSTPATGSGNWVINSASTINNYSYAPDGTHTASLVIETDGTSAQQLITNTAGTLTNGGKYTLSVFAKAAGNNILFLTAFGETTVYFNLDTGVPSNSNGKSKYYGNGWWRCEFRFTKSNTTGNVYVGASTDSSSTQTGEAYKKSILVWGAQLENYYFAGSLIPTTTAQVSRSNETCYTNTVSDTDDYIHNAEYTAVIQAATFGPVNDSNYRESLYTGYYDSSSWIDVGLTSFGTPNALNSYQNSFGSGTVTLTASVSGILTDNSGDPEGQTYNAVIRQKATDGVKLAVGSGDTTKLSAGDGSNTHPKFTRIYLGSRYGGSQWINGYIRSVQFYPEYVDDDALTYFAED